MSTVEAINQYIDETIETSGAFYLATVNGDKPATRPLGFKMVVDGKFYLGIGTFKAAYQQILANPNVQLVACKKDGTWIRVDAKAIPVDDPALVEKVWEIMPPLKGLYDSNGWQMGVLLLEDGKVDFIENAMQVARTETF
ncbi:MAG: pyridoxamine 5'-phosphate oxidase family protein [Coriobacteriales bacterium]|nr:pyridoxamine 5'-phosphate oxidase family protein [Coriobacteriales bacterium]